MGKLKGPHFIHIPRSIYLLNDLNSKQMFVLANICNVVCNGGRFYFDNKWIQYYTNVSKRQVTSILKSLIDKGYIKVQLIYKNNSKEVDRRIVSLTERGYKIGGGEVDFHRGAEVNFHRGTEVNFQDSNKHSLVNTIDNNNKEFDRFWKAYDYKIGRSKAERIWKKLTKREVSLIFKHLEKYIPSTYKDSGKYPSRRHPATYLNNRSWEDEVVTEKTNKEQEIIINSEKKAKIEQERRIRQSIINKKNAASQSEIREELTFLKKRKPNYKNEIN